MTKVGFVIAASIESPWREIHDNGQKKTWLTALPEDISYISAYSSGEKGDSWVNPKKHWRLEYDSKAEKKHFISDPVFFESNSATFEGVRGYGSLVGTSFSAIKYLVDTNKCDFVIRTNVSSYWNVGVLMKYLETSNSEIHYSGKSEKLFRHFTGLYRHENYASGAGIILSAEVASRFIHNYEKAPKKFIDDMAIGRLAFKLGIKCEDLPRIDIGHLFDVEEITQNQIDSNFHYRCKSYTENDGISVRGDIEIMKALHEKIVKN
jgi:hypothetical protein